MAAYMTPADADTEKLIALASNGDEQARGHLLARHRQRLRRMVAVRMDRRLTARLDPSDVVQEALAEASRKLASYLRDRPLPFYPWLRQIAWERLSKIHRRHLHSRKRSVTREQPGSLPLPDESAVELAQRLVDPGTSPSVQAVRAELAARVQAALSDLGHQDREVLIMRYLEQLSTRDIAAALGIAEGAVKLRQLRALQRLRIALGTRGEEGRS